MSEATVTSQYVWPAATRRELRIVAMWTNMTLSEASSMAIRLMYEAVEEIRQSGNVSISKDELKNMILSLLNRDPDIVKSLMESQAYL